MVLTLASQESSQRLAQETSSPQTKTKLLWNKLLIKKFPVATQPDPSPSPHSPKPTVPLLDQPLKKMGPSAYVPQMITLFSNGPAPEQGGWVFKSLCLTDSFECNLDPMSKKGLSSVVLVVKFDKNKKAEKCSCTPNDQNSQWNFEIPVWIWIIWLFMMDLWYMMPCWSHSKLKKVLTAGVN